MDMPLIGPRMQNSQANSSYNLFQYTYPNTSSDWDACIHRQPGCVACSVFGLPSALRATLSIPVPTLVRAANIKSIAANDRLPSMVLAMLLAIAISPEAGAAGQTDPYVPQSDATVLEHLPSTSDPRVRHFEVLKRLAQAQPGQLQPALALADAYLDYGRDTGDARYLGRAEAIIAPWIARQPAPDDALVVEATIMQSRHEFVEAKRILESVVQRNPGNTQAWLTVSSVYLIQGEMDKAEAACKKIADAGPLVAAGCMGAWSAVNGKARQSLDSIEAILEASRSQSPTLQAWGHGLMADAAMYLGLTDRADAEFRQALQFAPGDNFLLADYGDFLLDQGRPKEALALTRGYSQSDTSFLRQVIAEAALKLPAAQADIATMASRFRDLEKRGDSHLYAREEALFVLELQNDPARALQLARDNWSNQRAPKDASIYLEAALAAGKPEAAKDVVDFLDKTGLEDPKIRVLAKQVASRIESNSRAMTEKMP